MYLETKDLREIQTALLTCATDWYNLGLEFKLTYDDLATIRHTWGSDARTALREMLAMVLQQKKITWQTVVDAARAVGRDNVADKIVEDKKLQPTIGKKRKAQADSKHSSKMQKLDPSSHVSEEEELSDSESEEEISSFEDDSTSSEDEEDSDDTPQTITPLTDFCYPMDKAIHGRALIINIVKHKHKKNVRYGSDLDRDRLKATLETLGYEVKTENDLDAKRMKEMVLKHAKEATDCDSFVCCILAHGREGKVVGADGKAAKISNISRALTKVQHLVGKPKIFFFQACQGKEHPPSLTVADNDQGTSKQISKVQSTIPTLPRDSDFFWGYSSFSKTISTRNKTRGSQYIQALCDILDSQHETEDLVTMVTRVHERVAKKRSMVKGKKRRYQQQPQLVSTLRMLVRFKPPTASQEDS